MDYSIIKHIRYKNTASYKVKYALKHQERKDLIKECGVTGLVLFEYYLRIAAMEDKAFLDEAAAEYFGWSRITAKRHRLALVRAGWVLLEKAKTNTGNRIQIAHLGRDEVIDALKSGPSLQPLAGLRSPLLES